MVDIEKASEDFAVRIYNLYKYLSYSKKEYILSNQLLRSGTSIGANVSDAEGGITKKDFIAKMHIALKEAHETKYWLRIMRITELLNSVEYNSIYKDASIIEATIVKILKSSKSDN